MIAIKDAIVLLNERGKRLIKSYDLAFKNGIKALNDEEIKKLDEEIESSLHLVLKKTGYEPPLTFLVNHYYNASHMEFDLFHGDNVYTEYMCYNDFIILTLFGAKFKDAFETSLTIKGEKYDKRFC